MTTAVYPVAAVAIDGIDGPILDADLAMKPEDFAGSSGIKNDMKELVSLLR
jgi:hypothetical protein